MPWTRSPRWNLLSVLVAAVACLAPSARAQQPAVAAARGGVAVTTPAIAFVGDVAAPRRVVTEPITFTGSRSR